MGYTITRNGMDRTNTVIHEKNQKIDGMVTCVPTGYKNSYITDTRDVWHLHSRFRMHLNVRVCVDTLCTNV